MENVLIIGITLSLFLGLLIFSKKERFVRFLLVNRLKLKDPIPDEKVIDFSHII